jgi:uncharacterized protein YtpQ (UPF0354 family)
MTGARRAAAALAFGVFCLAGCAGREPTWQELLLRRDVSAADLTRAARLYLEARPEVASVAEEGELSLQVKLRSGQEHAVHLDNLMRALDSDRMARAAQLGRFLASVQDSAATETIGAPDRQRLLPLVKDVLFLAALQQMADQSRSLYRPLCGDLVVLYVLDSPESVRYVDARVLADLGLSAAAAPRVALDNFRARPPAYEWEIDGALRHLRADGTYEASFLLLPEMWNELAAELGGEPLVAVPARGELAVALNSSQNAETLRAWAHEVSENAPYAMTDGLIVWRHGAWVAL